MAKEKEEKKKVKRPTPAKRILQSDKRHARNKAFKSKVNSAIKIMQQSATAKAEPKAVQAHLAAVYSLMDKGVKMGIFKANKANRTKSRLTVKISK